MTSNIGLKLVRRVLPLLLLPLFAMGCDNAPAGPENGTAQLSVYLTDAAGDVENVWVQVNDVVLVGEGGQTALLDEPTELINLVELEDLVMPLSENEEVEAGTYSQLRFIIGGAVLETEDGEVYIQGDVEHPNGETETGSLQCPSCSQTGIKLNFQGGLTLADGDVEDVLMDFDVKQSFGRQAGASGMWVMNPVIHLRVGGVEPAGEIVGTVSMGDDANGDPLTIPQCAGDDRTLEAFVPVATTTSVTDDEGVIDFTGETDEDGGFEIRVLAEDTYDLGFESETVFDTEKLVWQADVDPAQATIDAENDEVAGVSYTITGVTCETTGS